MKTKIEKIFKSIFEANKKDIKNQITYLADTLTETEKFELYEALMQSITELTKEDKISIPIDPHLNKAYAELIERQERLTTLIEKIEFAASLIQPISDHSIRGTLFYLNKVLNDSHKPSEQ